MNLKSLLPWLALALTLTAFGIRAHNLGLADLTFDESASAFISGKPYAEMLTYLRGAIREHPPVYYAMLRAWSLAAGRSEYALRFFSVWFGVLGVALIYRFGRQSLGRAAALIAMALLTIQPFHVHYSQDARMYTLMAAEGLVLLGLFQRIRGDSRLRWWLAFGLVAAASVFTHYLMALVLVAINLYAISTLIVANHQPHISNLRSPISNLQFTLKWFGSQAIIGGLFAAYLFLSKGAYHLLWQFQGYTLQAIIGKLKPAWHTLDDLMWGVQAHPWPWWSYAVIALVIFGLTRSLLWRPFPSPRRRGVRGEMRSRWLLPIYLLVPLALTVAMPERPVARYMAAIIPAYCLALGLAVAWLGRRHWLLGMVACGLLAAANLNMLQINQAILKSDYGRVVSYLNSHLRPRDAIIFNGPWQWVQQLYYPVKPYPASGPNAPVYWLPPEPLPLDPAIMRQKLEEVASRYDRAWVLPAAIQDADPQHVILGWLNEHAYYSGNYKELELYTFDHAAQPELVQDAGADWGAFRLQQAALSRANVRPGEPVLVSLPLSILNSPGGDLMITLQLVDRDGNVWASQALRPGNDFNPPSQWQTGDQFVARQGVVVPYGAPPGDYALRVGVMLYPSEVMVTPSVDGHPLPNSYIEVNGVHVISGGEQLATSNQDIFNDGNITPLNATFGNALALVGIRLAGREFWQGHYVAFELVWRPMQALSEDYGLRISLVDSTGREVTSAETNPVADWYPTSQWAPDQWVSDRQALLIPPRQPPGTYKLRVSVLNAQGQPLPLAGTQTASVLGVFQRTSALSGTSLDAAQVAVRPLERTFRAGKISHPLSITLGDSVRLLGYDWDGPPRPGQNVHLVLYWQALREMDTPYTVFTHIIGPGETPAGQKDNWPRNGDYPTSFWMKGEVVSDDYLIPFSQQAPPGEYRLETGLYNTDTGERLSAVQNGQPIPNNAIILERFTNGE